MFCSTGQSISSKFVVKIINIYDIQTRKRKKETTISKYIWELKGENIPYTLNWKIRATAQPFLTSNQSLHTDAVARMESEK